MGIGRTGSNIAFGWGQALLFTTMSGMLASPASAADHLQRFHIEGGPLQRALVAYAAAAGTQLLYSSALVAGRTAPRLVGDFTPADALARLLEGSGLTARPVGANMFVLQGAPKASTLMQAATTASPAKANDAAAPTARAEQVGMMGTQLSVGAGSAAPDTGPDVVVTGSHIRGRQPGTPPVTTISRDDLTRNGYATVAQALQALPGNFGGVATEQSALSFADTTGTNGGLATGVNLRGLGASATLVLVNGKRLGGSGSQGSFADVSSIPTGAVDHVEVLMDGASAIYGSDAVGGVVNIILKRDFDGAETRARIGTVTQGSKHDLQLDQTVGKHWSTGGIVLSYEYDRAGRLASADRDFAASADLRPLGGTDHRFIFSLPGNILGIDPRTGIFGAAYAIPRGQDGTGLTPSSFIAGASNLENRREGSDLIPRQVRHSAYASLDQDLGSAVQLSADMLYAHRTFAANEPGSASIVQVGRSNPFFVSPNGATSQLIAYGFEPELGPIQTRGFAEALATSAGLDADLGHGWKVRGSIAFAQEREGNRTDHEINSAALAEAVGSTPDNPATAFNTTVDGYFNPYGTGASNSAAILSFIGDGFQETASRSRVLTGHADGDGTLLMLPGGPVKLAAGVDVRRETFKTSGVGLVSTAPQSLFAVDGSRTIEAGFAEVRVPVVGTNNARPGVAQLDLSLAGRVEHYASFGTTANPKFGLSWVPIRSLTVRTSYGTSFRAPNLRELGDAQHVSVTTLQRPDGVTLPVIQLSGGNPGLRPEKARSWTAGFDLVPVAMPRLRLSMTWFRTVFRNQIGTPAQANFSNALVDPTLAPFVERVMPISDPADLARINALYASPAFSGASGIPATSIGAIIDTRYINTGRLDVSGLDLSAHYAIDAGANRFDLAATGSYMLRDRQQVTPTSASVDQRNRVGEPVDLRGRLSGGWTRGIATTTVGLNYVAPYHDLVGNRIDAWKTVDLVIGVAPQDGHGPLHGLELAIVASNLFNAAPPFYDSPIGLGYDATNADALGRFVSLQLTKRW
ncbi:TonB-dependent receptor [Sphingomonas nostoxanthinifaciens]|uniref:TonB-dependent receptor n=1 Tax=Sphingomonas nostoxanthinifaciens TaxID=2872652 RepID=UPI001CC21A38|nr:TonB-dependent receptor [Sphingomonas nostoxanthinifaciens]UAK25467.1 TonB-dependent receptor [Sphingomonas nostoxanthinifaciens]